MVRKVIQERGKRKEEEKGWAWMEKEDGKGKRRDEKGREGRKRRGIRRERPKTAIVPHFQLWGLPTKSTQI